MRAEVPPSDPRCWDVTQASSRRHRGCLAAMDVFEIKGYQER